MSETQHSHLAALLGQRAQGRPEPKAFVIGVGANSGLVAEQEQAAPARS